MYSTLKEIDGKFIMYSCPNIYTHGFLKILLKILKLRNQIFTHYQPDNEVMIKILVPRRYTREKAKDETCL